MCFPEMEITIFRETSFIKIWRSYGGGHALTPLIVALPPEHKDHYLTCCSCGIGIQTKVIVEGPTIEEIFRCKPV